MYQTFAMFGAANVGIVNQKNKYTFHLAQSRHLCVCVSVCLPGWLAGCLCLCLCLCVCVCVYVCMCVCVYVYVCACVGVRVGGVNPCFQRIYELLSFSVLRQGVQAAHPVLHQRRHWMSAGDI